LPIPDAEIEKLTALVRETIGMDDKRGDSIKLVTAPFQEVKEVVDDTPLWKRPETIDLVRTLAVPAALTLAALIVVFGAIRPAIQAAKPLPPPEPEAGETAVTALNAVVDDEESLPGAGDNETLALEGPGPDKRLEMAIQLSKDNPLAVANVLRGWMNN
jgi:flagellar M-ring protein FliF